jgi:outer membrane protein insertion porin family
MHNPWLLQPQLQPLMMYKNLFVGACLLCLANTYSFAAQTEQEPVVEDIIVIGANAEVEQVLQGMSLVVGKEFSATLLEDSVEWLWNHMRMRVLQIRKLPGASTDSIVIELLVESLRSWKQVVFEGQEELSPPEIEIAVGLTGQTIDELELTKYEQRILSFYFEQGFRGTEVSAVDRGDYLAFVIYEGNQLVVTDVRFEGNTFFNEGGVWGIFHWGLDLHDSLQQTEGFFSDDDFSAEVVVEDVNTLIMLYRDYGFLDVKVNCRLEDQDSASGVVLIYEIDEGARYTIRSIQFKNSQGGGLMIEDDELGEISGLAAGQFYSSARLAKSSFDIQTKYGEFGHPSMRKVVSTGDKAGNYFWVGGKNGSGAPDLLFDYEAPVVDVVFTIQEGKAFRLRDVVLRGHLGTQDRIVRRQIELEPGDEAREDLVNRSWRRLNGLGYFKDANNNPAVDWHWQQVDSRPDLMDLVFDVQDKGMMNNFRFGGAWNSERGPALMVNLTKSNVDMFDGSDSFTDVFTDLQAGRAFHGAGQSLRIAAQPGRRYSSYSVSFTEPDLFREHIDRFGLNISTSKNLRYQRSHEEQRIFSSFTLSRRFGRNFSVFAGPTFGSVVLEDIASGAPEAVTSFSGSNSYTTLMFGARRNTVLDQFSPVDGSMVSMNVAQTGGFLGGDWSFTKSSLKMAKHFDLWEDAESHRWILSVKGAVQKAWLQGDMTILPYSESFFQGGYRTLRGFAFRGTNRDANGFAEPGSAAWNASIELGFPLFATRSRQVASMLENVRGSAFVDFGALGSNFGEMTSTRVSTGIAVQIRMPFMAQLPISLIFAKPLRLEDNDQTATFQLQMGSSF